MSSVERRAAVFIVMLMVVVGIVESTVVAMVLPLVYIIVEPQRFAESSAGHLVTGLLGIGLDQTLPLLAFVLCILLATNAALSLLTIYWSEAHSARCRDRLASLALSSVLAAPNEWLLKHDVGNLAQYLIDHVRWWRRDFIHSILSIVQSLIMVAAPIGVVVALAPGLGLVAIFALAALSAAIVLPLRRRIRRNAGSSVAENGLMMRSLFQCLMGARDIKVSGRIEYFVARFDRHNTLNNALGVRARVLGSSPPVLISLVGQIGFLLTALVLWNSGQPGSVVAGQLALFAVVVARVVPGFNRLAAQFAILMKSAPPTAQLVDLIATLNQITSAKERAGLPLSDGWRHIELRNVSFSYPKASVPAVQDISLRLERGKSYGFVGRSGSGKTTLMNMILGLQPPTLGDIFVGATALSEIDSATWFKRFGYVPQNPFILDGTIEENITFGAPHDPELLQSALRASHLDEFVKALPAGLATQVGEVGKRLSGGQAQRLAIARAVFKRPEILFLDEATSALDSITESEVAAAFSTGMQHTLKLMIAHRVTTLRACDRIYIMDAGRIVASGTYEELLRDDENFRGLAAVSRDETSA